MNEVYKQIPLYRYLSFCNESDLERTVLDCGAGGDSPPLGLFAQYGYVASGIDCNPEQIDIAQAHGLQKRAMNWIYSEGICGSLPLMMSHSASSTPIILSFI